MNFRLLPLKTELRFQGIIVVYSGGKKRNAVMRKIAEYREVTVLVPKFNKLTFCESEIINQAQLLTAIFSYEQALTECQMSSDI